MFEERLEIRSIAARLALGEEVEIDGVVYVRKADSDKVCKSVCASCALYTCSCKIFSYCVLADAIQGSVGHLEKIGKYEQG